eukprot:3225984-Ditylum_brightwellii.AAC.1
MDDLMSEIEELKQYNLDLKKDGENYTTTIASLRSRITKQQGQLSRLESSLLNEKAEKETNEKSFQKEKEFYDTRLNNMEEKHKAEQNELLDRINELQTELDDSKSNLEAELALTLNLYDTRL